MGFEKINIQNLQLNHEVNVNSANGSVTGSVEIPLTKGRSGFGPNLGLNYSSSSRNSAFGLGWSLTGISSITIDTKKGLPRYDGSDNYAFNGVKSILPSLFKSGNEWKHRTEEKPMYWIFYYRAKIEDSFIRFEKWVRKDDGSVHWRTVTGNHIVSIYGIKEGKICNSSKKENIFTWLLEEQYDNLGNAIHYTYKKENTDNVDGQKPSEYQRVKSGNKIDFPQKYIEKISYGNSLPLHPNIPIPPANQWLFEVLFDYGEYDNRPYESTLPANQWAVRQDPFSIYNPGFEIRTYRLCRRILTYHNIPKLSIKPSLTGIFEIEFNENPLGTTIQKFHYIGVRRDLNSGNYSEKSLPSLSFNYTESKPDTSFKPIVKESNINVPHGFNSPNTRFIDLFGEGLPGILTESTNNWYYKHNKGNGIFEKQETVISKPSELKGIYSLGDFDQDGNLNLFTLQGRTAGYYEYNTDRQTWSGFNAFKSIPQVSNAKFMDVNADGYADIVVETTDKLTCYPFKGKEGFGQPFEFAKPQSNGIQYPPTIGDNLPLDYFMADMTGDGLQDQVRIKNGRVEFYPNHGNGQFGSGVLMDNPPVFDYKHSFDASRIRLFDLDGSGTTDIIYLGRGEIKYWYNASGNGFVEGGIIKGLPYIDLLCTAVILDLLGNGSPCLVWSNSLSYAVESPIQYLELTGGVKPRLLKTLDNGMGVTMEIKYGYSGNHYNKSQQKGKPWISKIPSHFPVVDQKILVDHITNSKMATTYQYYDGHYDGNEKSLVCFGRIEQYDVETFDNAALTHEKDYVQPSCTITWLHPGIFGWDSRMTKQFYKKDSNSPLLPPPIFESEIAQSIEEFELGFRCLAGKMVRQELYAVQENGALEENPFSTIQRSYIIRKNQPSSTIHDGSFYAYQSEEIEIAYDGNPNDSKITHQLSLHLDDYGNTTKGLTIAYARNSNLPVLNPLQSKDYITIGLHSFQSINTIDNYQTSILYQSKGFEINHIARNPDEILKWKDVKTHIDTWTNNALSFDKPLAVGGNTMAKLIEWKRTYYWNKTQNDVLPLGQFATIPLIHHEENACFNDSFINQIYNNRVSPNMLSSINEGNYNLLDGYWWQRTEVSHFNGHDKYYSLDKIEKHQGIFTIYSYDDYFLSVVEITDAIGNKNSGLMDYNIVEPYRLVDANDNVSEVMYDALGIPVITTHHGTVLHNGGIEPYGYSPIDMYNIRNDESFDNIIANPELYIQNAAAFHFYDFNSIPLRSISLTRENLLHDGKGNQANTAVIQIDLEYQDGLGRIIQHKRKVEPGPAIQKNQDGSVNTDAGGEIILVHHNIRWLASGHVVYNNKELPVRQFEPFFSGNHLFEDDTELENYGVSIQQYYDAVGRMYRSDFPDSTFLEIVSSPWEIKYYDQNDTVDRSLYKVFREILPADSPEKLALDKSLAHKETPTITEFDPLGREITKIETNNNATIRKIETQYDVRNNPVKITDPRGLIAFQYKRDMMGRLLYEDSMDSGEKWSFPNHDGEIIHLWDSRNIHQRIQYDGLNRVTDIHVEGGLGLNQITEKFVYGEDVVIAQAKEKNLRGRLVIHYDQTGIQEVKLAAPGNSPLLIHRKFLDQYINEPDWSIPGNVGLSADIYSSLYEYDGLGRTIVRGLPDQTTCQYVFNRGGGLQKILVSTADNVLTNVEILKDSSMDAKGMKQEILLGNDVKIDYTYDSETFRMKRLRSRKTTGTVRTYQDIHYTYDPMGNLIHLLDEAQQPNAANPHVIEGLNVSAHSEFEYDALYQIKSAKGRVHQALLQNDYADRSREIGLPANWGKGSRHITLNNGGAIERYTRTYEYDESGNIKTIKHSGASQNWTNHLWTSATSNRSLPLLNMNGVVIANPESRFDANGNCIFMPHLRKMEWNYRNNISKVVVIDRSAQGKPNDEEYYVYGGDGKRLRKITQRLVDIANDTIELTEKVYFDGCETKTIKRGGIEILKRYTSTVGDGDHTIALIHSWEKDNTALETDDISKKKIHYFLTNHLGSTALELDDMGNVITYEEYFPYGGTSFIAGRNKREIDLKEYRYSGKERDDFTGLYYFQYRYYAHWIGGWISPDPLGPEDSLNLFLYVHNNPINVVDINGLQSNDPNDLIREAFTRYNLAVVGVIHHEGGGMTELFAGTVLEARLSSVVQTNVSLSIQRSETGEITAVNFQTNEFERNDLETVYNREYGSFEIRPRTTPIFTVIPESPPENRPSPRRRSTPRTPTPPTPSTVEPSTDQVAPEAEREETPPPAAPEPEPEPEPPTPEVQGVNETAPTKEIGAARTMVQETARPTAGSVSQTARQRAGIPRQFTPGEPLRGPYNLWSNEPGGGLADAARRPGYIMEDTVLEDIAEATARRLGYTPGTDPITGPYDARYNPNLNWRSPNFNQSHFDDIWHPTSDSLAIRAGTSMTPVTSNGLEPWRNPPHTNPQGTVQLSREIPRINLAGGLMGQFAKVSGILTIVVSSDIENPYVRTIGIASGATEFVGGSAYMLGAADLAGGYFGVNGASRLMTFGSGAVRVGGGVGMIVLSGYSGVVHYQQGEYGVLVGDGAGVGLGTMILTNTATGPAVALTGTALVANYAGDYVESRVTPKYGRTAGVVSGTATGLGIGAAVGGGLVAFGLVSNPVGWGILAVGGVAGLIGALW
ncbi:SpvB/TcaC N-terminal domain-containing protein [Membranihabitans marinus]|uniref:SpvB/TcaC N-terminal domain-containing protein n=1 Tax=Membranihabitans marinus TaxID=1227546 RepID=UPI001F3A5B12|nr:SpvB/TcaC N-terminal domain-containing protein [Membranihabitans marinus]